MHEIFVVHKKDPVRSYWHREYCGRGSVWGNPYEINENFTRKDVIKLFDDYFIKNQDKFQKDLERLLMISETTAVELECFCYPKPCHCDIIRSKLISMQNEKLANQIFDEKD